MTECFPWYQTEVILSNITSQMNDLLFFVEINWSFCGYLTINKIIQKLPGWLLWGKLAPKLVYFVLRKEILKLKWNSIQLSSEHLINKQQRY